MRMAAEKEKCLSPLLDLGTNAELEPLGIILPPLNRTTQGLNSSPGGRQGYFRKSLIGGLAVGVIVLITIIVTATLLSGSSKSAEGSNEILFENPTTERENHRKENKKPEPDFRTSLINLYEKLREKKKVDELQRIFNYYHEKSADVRDVEDLRSFIALIRSEEAAGYSVTDNEKILARLNDSDIEITCQITEEFRNWYDGVVEVRDNLTRYATQKEICETGGLSGGYQMQEKVGKKRREVDGLVREWTLPLEVTMENTFLVMRRKAVLLSEVQRKLRTIDSNVQNVLIFAERDLFLDDDLHVLGRNLALIAPNWHVLKENVAVYLSGLDGGDYPYAVAERGIHGRPGRRGGDGGLFLGVGDFDGKLIKVYSDGGRGGNGQDGANGLDGRNALATRLPREDLFRDPLQCVIPIEESGFVNKYGEIIMYYKVYDNFGCGRPGANGGAAGEGGTGGSVMFVDTIQKMVFSYRGDDGAQGRPGKGGAPGIGAKSGCFFYATGKKNSKPDAISPIECGNMDMPGGLPGRDGIRPTAQESKFNTNFFSEVLVSTRNFARHAILNGNEELALLLSEMDEIRNLALFTKISDLLTEMESLDKYGKVEFYESLSRRIEVALEETRDNALRHLLAYLRVVSYGKALSLKDGTDNFIVIDLEKHLESLSDELVSAEIRQDDTVNVLTEIIESKISYLKDSFELWASSADGYLHTSGSSGLAISIREFKTRKLFHLTLVTSRVLQSLCNALLKNLLSDTLTIDNLNETSELLSEYESSYRNDNVDPSIFSRNLILDIHNQIMSDLRALTGRAVPVESVKHCAGDLRKYSAIFGQMVSPKFHQFAKTLEHLEETLKFLDKLRGKMKFWKSLEDTESFPSGSSYDAQLNDLKKRVSDMRIAAQYRDALNAFKQWVFPHMHVYEERLPKGDQITLEDAKKGITLLKKWVKEYASRIVSYDKHIRKATFSSNNSVGEYYKWYNKEVNSELKDLFWGRRVSLTADVENIHMFSREAIKFKTIRLEIQPRNGIDPQTANLLKNGLNNIEVQMVHSGYSYYSYNGRTYLMTGKELDLQYSYQMDQNGEPVTCNMVYKKLMEGPPIYSPFTTWTFQLRPLNVVQGLAKYADKVDISLIGTGSYTAVPES